MRVPTAINIAQLAMWWMLYGISLWWALLIAGFIGERLPRHLRRHARHAMWLLAAFIAAGLPNLVTAGRGPVLMEQGLVHSPGTMHLHGFIFSLTIALLYFAHLRRSRVHEQAVARLAAAQASQRHARRRMVQARLLELQARIDPQVLFRMLEVLRRLYQDDAARAEHFLEELTAFLRAALPRLRTPSSSLLREADLACAFVRLHSLASGIELSMVADVAPDVLHARFPPGALLPLLESTVGGSDRCRLSAARSNDACRLVLTLGAAPAAGAVGHVRSLLVELYGSAGNVTIEKISGAVNVLVQVPYELA
jgi:hypothetical protein